MREKIEQLICIAAGVPVAAVTVPEQAQFGHYATNIALQLHALRSSKSEGGAKETKRPPLELAKELAVKIAKTVPAGFFEKVEAAPPGFVNFWLTNKAIWEECAKVNPDDVMGAHALRGQTVMVEFTDPNPFKLFHIGHLMSNAIGESIARLYEAVGANVLRVNYQGDVGLHVAMSIWGMQHAGFKAPSDAAPLLEKVEYLGKAYAAGSAAYRASDDALERGEIETLNKAIYEKSNPSINALYDMGKKWSLEYFEAIYKKLGTKFDHYFFESEIAEDGLAIVAAHPDTFPESDGARVFRGEEYGLHTRVFVNSKGLPTYEAKELGLNKKKFELYNPNLSVVITANEINDYFKVLLKAMALVLPEVALKTVHIGHGFLRLSSGKMSSRTGNVITAEALIKQVKEKVKEKEGTHGDVSAEVRAANREPIAIGAIKYSILKQGPGQDIVFDFERSLSVEGDSGPYLQYAYARLKSVLRKAEEETHSTSSGQRGERKEESEVRLLDAEVELELMRKIIEFPDVVDMAAEKIAPNYIATYLFSLANLANRFYGASPIMKESDEARRNARLALAALTARVLKRGLHLLGIEAPEKM